MIVGGEEKARWKMSDVKIIILTIRFADAKRRDSLGYIDATI